jgi:putative chitinase
MKLPTELTSDTFGKLLVSFKRVFPKAKNPDELVKALELITLFNINTTERVAMFLAQCGHESAGFSTFKENLNYSAKALNAVFPKYFKNAGRDAEAYARQPEKIANIVYANRMGNGNIASGDGWKYRGRGLIQLTGKNNYVEFSKDFDLNEIVENPDLVSDNLTIAVKSAVWFWIKNDLNKFADSNDIKGATKRINGGYIGLDERTKLYEAIKKNITEILENL